MADEIGNRANNGNIKRVQKARLPCQKTVEEFDFAAQPSLNRQHIYQFGTCGFIRKKENISFIGRSGTGRTHLSIAIGIKAIQQGYVRCCGRFPGQLMAGVLPDFPGEVDPVYDISRPIKKMLPNFKTTL